LQRDWTFLALRISQRGIYSRGGKHDKVVKLKDYYQHSRESPRQKSGVLLDSDVRSSKEYAPQWIHAKTDIVSGTGRGCQGGGQKVRIGVPRQRQLRGEKVQEAREKGHLARNLGSKDEKIAATGDREQNRILFL